MAQVLAGGAALALTALGKVLLVRHERQQATNVSTDIKTIESMPDFAALGVTNSNVIREELRRGPSISFYIGPEAAHFTLPTRLVMYHSAPLARSLRDSANTTPRKFPEHDPTAFAKVQTWLNEGSFGFEKLGQYISSHCDLRTGTQEACNLLCRISFIAEELEIAKIQVQVLAKLRDATALAQTMNHPFPLQPEMVVEIHRRSPAPSALLDFLVEEMKKAALRGAVDIELYAECFQTYPALGNAVLKQGVADRIILAWKRMAEDEARDGDGSEVVVDAGREAGWWKGPF